MAQTEYVTTVELPIDVKDFFESLSGQARVGRVIPETSEVEIYFDFDGDQYELALRVREISDEACRYVGETMRIKKPRIAKNVIEHRAAGLALRMFEQAVKEGTQDGAWIDASDKVVGEFMKYARLALLAANQ